MNHLRSILWIFIFALICSSAVAQSPDMGMWYSFGIEKKLNKWQLETEAELRTINQWNQVDQWNISLEPSYSLFKPVTLGLGYKFIDYHDFKYDDYQPRNRFYVFATGKLKVNQFKFSLKEKVQVTTKDESDRIKKNGEINTYKINPAWMWRNQFKINYNIPQFPVNPAFSVETFYQLNNPDGNQFNKLRYELMLYYNISKSTQLKVFGLLDQPINQTNETNTLVGGVGYYISF